MNTRRADYFIRSVLRGRPLREAIDSPQQAAAILAKYHYQPDPREPEAKQGWYAHEHGHKVLVRTDPSVGLRWQSYQMGTSTYEDFTSGTGVFALEQRLEAAHGRGVP